VVWNRGAFSFGGWFGTKHFVTKIRVFVRCIRREGAFSWLILCSSEFRELKKRERGLAVCVSCLLFDFLILFYLFWPYNFGYFLNEKSACNKKMQRCVFFNICVSFLSE
jgi:uncharacterized membrane protein (DUF485 family)